MLTVWGQDERFIDTYYKRFNKDPNSKDWRDWPFMCGDGAQQSEDGYFRILGRIDDVINVAGHRLGTKELESAAIEVDEVAEAAAVPVFDETRGKVVEMYVAVKPGIEPSDEEVAKKVSAQIERDIGKIARPKNVWVVPDMPKTRLGQDHAPRDRGDLELRRRRRRLDARQPRGRREDPEQVQSAKKERGEDRPALREGEGGDHRRSEKGRSKG